MRYGGSGNHRDARCPVSNEFRYGDVFLSSKFKKGQWLELPQRDVDVIYQMAGLPGRDIAPLSKKIRNGGSVSPGRAARCRSTQSADWLTNLGR